MSLTTVDTVAPAAYQAYEAQNVFGTRGCAR